MGICVQKPNGFQPCLFQKALHFFHGITPLEMGLRKAPEQPAFFLPCKNSQIIFIDMSVLMIIVFPDETAFFPVFSNGGIPNDLLIFIHGIKVKEEDPSRIKIIIHQAKGFQYLFVFQKIIHGIAYADHRSHCAVQIQLPHILAKIQDGTA